MLQVSLDTESGNIGGKLSSYPSASVSIRSHNLYYTITHCNQLDSSLYHGYDAGIFLYRLWADLSDGFKLFTIRFCTIILLGTG